MTLTKKWIDILYGVATGSRRMRNCFTPVGAFFYGLLIFFFIVLAVMTDRAIGLSDVLPKTSRILWSLPAFALALVLIGWSVFSFFKAKGTPVPFNPPPRLVMNGPYQYTRNPMLTGVFALLLGLGFLLGSITLLLFFTPLFILMNYWELKTIEEPELVKRLGNDYIAYRQRTPMFFPKLSQIIKRRPS